jgi:hypothetical protein
VEESQPADVQTPNEWPAQTEATPHRPPRWLAEDGKVLRFFAWYREDIPEAPLEPWRVRRVVLLYYLVDDTVQLYEPTQHNSGLHQVIRWCTLQLVSTTWTRCFLYSR